VVKFITWTSITPGMYKLENVLFFNSAKLLKQKSLSFRLLNNCVQITQHFWDPCILGC
jgi:hypothetical protein